MQKLLHNKTTIRLIFSFMFVFILPVLILYFLYTNSVVGAIEKEAQEIVYNDLIASIGLLDSEFGTLDDTIKMFQRGRGYQSYLTNGFSYDSSGTSSNAQIESDVAYIYLLGDPIDDFFLVFHNENSIISINGLYRPSTYLERYYKSDNLDLTSQLEYFAQISEDAVVHHEELTTRNGTGEYLSFVYPLSRNIFGDGATAVICVNTQNLSAYFLPRSEDFQTSTVVFSNTGDYLFSYNIGQDAIQQISEMLDQLPAGSSVHTIEGKEYTLIQQQSDYNKWQYITLLPEDNSLYQNTFGISRFFGLYIVLTLLIGLLAIAGFFWLNYKPIHLLMKKAKRVMQHDKGDGAVADDFGTISNALSYLHDRNLALNTTLIHNIREIRSHRLTQLLNGYYESVEEFNADCEQISMAFHHDYFYVSIVMLPGVPENPQEIIDLLLAELSKDNECLFIYTPKQEKVIFLHCVDGKYKLDMEPFFSALGSLHDQFNVSATIGIGHIQNGTDVISKSYMQATDALNYRLIKGTGTIITYDDVMAYYEDSYQYPKRELNKLENSLQARNANAVQGALEDLMAYISNAPLCIMNLRCVCFDVVKMLLADANLCPASPRLLPEALMQLSNESNKPKIIKIMQNVCAGVQIGNDSQQDPPDSQLLNDILEFIGENYCRCDFSIQEVADHFKMLPSNISHFFKVNMNCGLLEYLIDLRITRAKELLHTTDLSIKEISLYIGYYNASSFIRRFKQHEGVTPNEYRFAGKQNN